ncbi:DNA mismatch repair protein MutL [Leucogyrophana mollusca]|uniref:DNA mismatch repair protein MutL n=1 Tax=Leucogyrophana mollusca TaxID=85980 RepID=A0ACB8BK69_9AGAM|nr:DNA mismatch repair protein MutL [Leucogyrophana mollusca]
MSQSAQIDRTSEAAIRAIDSHSIHRITSGQVVIDLQTAVKELVENSLDAGATNIEVRFQNYGLKSFEVIDNGSGIAPKDYDSIALKHHTSKLASFEDLSTVMTFGFRGEALSSLCALSDGLCVTTATSVEAPMGTVLEMDRNGKVRSRSGKVARQRGTTVSVTALFKPLPVRRKELERNAKREFGKAMNLLTAYALVPCTNENKGVRLIVSNHPDGGRKAIQLRTDGSTSTRASVTSLWGPKALENIVDLDLSFEVETEKAVLRRLANREDENLSASGTLVRVRGLISKFAVGAGRTGSDRQFFFINGRPCNPSKVQKAFNEVYRSFNANQSPFIVADFVLPTHACDINVSPDKRTIFLHSENNLVQALKVAIEEAFSSSRSTYDVGKTSPQQAASKTPQGNLTTRTSSDLTGKRKGSEITGRGPTDSENCDSITMGKPHLLIEPETSNGSGSNVPGLSDKPAAQPLFLPDPDEDQLPGAVDAEDGGLGIPLPDVRKVEAPPARKSSPPRESVTGKSGGGRLGRASPVQMVLSTRGASWNLRRDAGDDGAGGPARKRPRLDGVGESSKKSFRSSLREFASAGSQLPVDKDDEKDESGDEDESPQEEVDKKGVRGVVSDAMDEDDQEEDELDELDELKEPSRFGSTPKTRVEAKRPSSFRNMRGVNRGAMDEDDHEEDELDEPDDPPPSGQAIAAKIPRKIERSTKPPRKAQATQEDEMDVDEPDAARNTGPSASHAEDISYDQASSTDMAGAVDASSSVIDLTNDGDNQADTSFTITDVHDDEANNFEAPSSTLLPEVVRHEELSVVTLRFDIARVMETYRQLHSRISDMSQSQDAEMETSDTGTKSADAGFTNVEDGEKASAALSRIIDKNDFRTMEILGQFNLGFIVTRRRKDGSSGALDDLFIVDQHAADEKYNFETLQQTTVIQSQKLFRPQPLQLTAADEMLAVENIDILKQNGFEVAHREDAVAGEEHRLELVAQPVSKSTAFDMKDLEEIIHLMQDRPTGTMVRCSKARAMFAMRACRKSVMIGMPLNVNQMTTVVQHMGTMDQPWNCPHGRPTMRHLSDLTSFAKVDQVHGRIDWASFVPP